MRTEFHMVRSAASAAILALCLTSLTNCALFGFDSWHWKQKLTLTVQTPHGLVSGSSVTAIDAGTSPDWLPGEGAGGMGSETTGEAVVVELGSDRYLFALLGNETETALTAFFPNSTLSSFERAERLETLRQTKRLERKRYPRLVTFANVNAPQSVSRVEPDNLAASFGPGYRLVSITLEITDEPVTEGRVEEVLGWWCGYRNRQARLNGSTSIAISTNELSDNLGTGAFRIGDCT